MLEVDLHTHSFFSACGIHTHLEILNRAKELGMKAVAITDHGPALEPRFTRPLYDRLREPVKGIRFLKGMECNLLDSKGSIDVLEEYLQYLDIILLGIHPNTEPDQGEARNTNMLINAMKKNSCIDIISHPNDPIYPVELPSIAEAAKEYGIALELNNSKTMLGRVDPEVTRKLVKTCKEVGCRMAVCSDMHAIEELGLDDAVVPYIKEVDFPPELIVNRTAESAFLFIEERRENKI